MTAKELRLVRIGVVGSAQKVVDGAVEVVGDNMNFVD